MIDSPQDCYIEGGVHDPGRFHRASELLLRGSCVFNEPRQYSSTHGAGSAENRFSCLVVVDCCVWGASPPLPHILCLAVWQMHALIHREYRASQHGMETSTSIERRTISTGTWQYKQCACRGPHRRITRCSHAHCASSRGGAQCYGDLRLRRTGCGV